jgi:hypothetical protein
LEAATLQGSGLPKPDVFLSYAREDEARAGELARALETRDYKVFWDREIRPGQTWHSHIGEALAKARCVVVAWSQASVISQWVIEEANEGRDRKVLVPVLFEAVQPPFGFRGIQAADLIGWQPARPSPAFDGLLDAVRRIVSVQSGSGAATAITNGPCLEMLRPSRHETGGRSAFLVALEDKVRTGRTLSILVAIIAGLGATGYWWLSLPTPKPPARESSKPAEPQPAVAIAIQSPEEMRDCEQCPLMLLVPAGEFTMGSLPDQRGRDEIPRHKVTFAAPLWVTKSHEASSQPLSGQRGMTQLEVVGYTTKVNGRRR